jgi:CheY-like chemotaxis protein
MDLDSLDTCVTDTLRIGAGILSDGRCFLDTEADPPMAEAYEWRQDTRLDHPLHGVSSGLSPMGPADGASKPEAATILLVDDDAVDVAAIRRAFRKLDIVNPIALARNGIEALEMLHGENDHAKLEAPLLILLDLNMPRMGGIEFLEELRADPELRRTLVFVMTTSAAEEDREHAYEYNIAGYVVKGRPGQTFLQSIAALESYWRMIELPD